MDRWGLLKVFAARQPGLRLDVVHVGAGSALAEIPPFDGFPLPLGNFYRCEPDAATLPGVQAENVTILPVAISDRDGERALFVCQKTGASSFYAPNTELLDRWYYGDGQPLAAIHKVVESRLVPTRSLDSLIADGAIPGVDFLRMNIQGGELDALKGGRSALERAVGIQIELSFDATYLGAPFFSDIEPMLRRCGFVLLDVLAPNDVSYAEEFSGGLGNERRWRFPGRQFFEAHCLFLKDPIRASLPAEKATKVAIVAEMYGQLSFALAILKNCAPDNVVSGFKQRWRAYLR